LIETHAFDEAVKKGIRKELHKAKEVASNVVMSPAGQELAIVKLSTQNEILKQKANHVIDQLEKLRYTIIKVMIRAMHHMVLMLLGRAFRGIALGWRNHVCTALKEEIVQKEEWREANAWQDSSPSHVIRVYRIWSQLHSGIPMQHIIARWRLGGLGKQRMDRMWGKALKLVSTACPFIVISNE